VFLRTGPTDLRLGFDGLCGLVANRLSQDPASGHVFVFCNQSRTRVKILTWDGSGLWLCTKRLESGTFRWPMDGKSEIGAAELHAILGGLEIGRQRKWFRR
jgi:transposase